MLYARWKDVKHNHWDVLRLACYVCMCVGLVVIARYTQGPDRWDPINGNYGKSGE